MNVPLMNGHADLDRNVVVTPDGTIKLSPNESKLFLYLAQREGQTVDHPELLREVFGYAATVQSRTVITTMQRLRKKVEVDPAEPVHLQSVYGRGYRFEPHSVVGDLIGRSAELAELGERLAEGRLWLVAPGGFGKSVLAHHFAATTAHQPLLVDLTDLSTMGAMTGAIAQALGVPRLQGPEVLESALRHQAPSLIVLDAAEHLGESLVPFVQRWSEFAPVLVTSRVPFASEPTMALGPLAPKDAERLFERSAPVALAPERLHALVKGLQGVPLALELASARLSMFSPAELAEHLHDLSTLLTGGTARQTSMRAVLDWSWRHTPPPLQEALTRLAPARQGIAVADAVTLLGADGFTLLTQLRQWGWWQRRAERVLLLDPVRQFIASVSDQRGAEQAHLQLFVQRARQQEQQILDGNAVAFVRTEWGNLSAAFETGCAALDPLAAELALVLAPALIAQVPTDEALRWLDQSVAMAEGDLLGQVLVERANLWIVRASLDAADSDLDRATQVGTPNQGMLWFRRAKIHQRRGAFGPAIALLRQALAVLSDGVVLYAKVELGFCLMSDQQLEEAEQVLREVLVRSRIQRAPGLTVHALGTLGFLYEAQDKFEEAHDAYEEALRVAHEVGHDDNAAVLHNRLGNLHFYQGRGEPALHHWTLSLALHQRVGGRYGCALAEVNLAQLRLVQRSLVDAATLAESARTTFAECGATPAAAFAALTLGRIDALQDRWVEAERWWAKAEPHIPLSAAWQLGAERCMARAEQGDLTGAREALASGAEGTDASSRAGRSLAEGFWNVAALGSGDGEDDERHGKAVEEALRESREVVDLTIRDLADRLSEKLRRARGGRGNPY